MITPITGDRFRDLCGHVLDRNGYRRQEAGDARWWFVKTNCVPEFARSYLGRITERFYLLSHNSDLSVDDRLQGASEILAHPLLLTWWSTNVATHHFRLRSAPLGLGCPNWPYGDAEAFARVFAAPREKDALVHRAFRIDSNPAQRELCAKHAGRPTPRKPFEEYLADVARSYFVVSPEGAGVDCHRTWEALYLGAVPIVTYSLHMANLAKDLPILQLRSWEEFRFLHLTTSLHASLMREFDPAKLDVRAVFERMGASTKSS